MIIVLEIRDGGKVGRIETEIDDFLLDLCPDKAEFVAKELCAPLEEAIKKMKTEQYVSVKSKMVEPKDEHE